MLKELIFFLLLAGTVSAQELNRVTVESLQPDGKITKSGLGFFYDSRTLVCSYSEVKNAAKIRVRAGDSIAFSNRVLGLNEDMDVAVLQISEEWPSEYKIGNSNLLAIGDAISFSIESKGQWTSVAGKVQSITDTGKGFNLIFIQSASSANRSVPLYNTQNQVVGWLQGGRAVPLEMIAQLAEKSGENVTYLQANTGGAQWKFKKPPAAAGAEVPQVGDMITFYGPTAFPFRIDLPQTWRSRAYKPSPGFLLRTDDPQTGVCAELRAMHASNSDILEGIDRTETTAFPGLSRSELIPFSTNHFTGFRAQYEDSDSRNPFRMDVFYTAFSGNFYVVSVSYPQTYEDKISVLVDQIFSSFRQ